MRAVVITSHGGIDGIGVLEVESPPTPVADRLRVRVCAAGLNRADVLQRRGSRSIEEKAEATRLFASYVLPLVSRGAIRPVIDRVYPVDEIREAHERMESNRSFGKIVLTFA